MLRFRSIVNRTDSVKLRHWGGLGKKGVANVARKTGLIRAAEACTCHAQMLKECELSALFKQNGFQV